MMKETRLGLGAAEAKVLSDFSAKGKSVFSISELELELGSAVKARKMASKLVTKNWLKRLKRGVYLLLELGAGSKPEWTEDSYYIASKLASPYYVGFYNMFNEYGWTEQIPFSVTVVTTRRFRPVVINGVSYKPVVLSEKKFFGTTVHMFRGREIVVSDPEKTLVDALDHPEYAGGIMEVAKAAYNLSNRANSSGFHPFGSSYHPGGVRKVDWKKVVEYAERMGNGAILKRLGYLVDLMELPLADDLREAIRSKLTKGYAPLYPGTKSKGKHNSKWRLVINAEISKDRVLA